MMVLLISLFSTLGLSSARDNIHTEVIEYKQGDKILKGYLAYDSSHKEKRPGILVFPEWWGLNDYAKQRARQLAEMGYIAFAVDMYGNGAVAANPQEASSFAGKFYGDRQLMRQRAAAALEVLKNNSLADNDRLAAIGFCFGGSCALELARSGADLIGVVSFHGGLATPTPADAKNIKGSVLVLHGGDDTHVKKEDLMAFWKEMQDSGADWEINIYGDAVHSFTNPAAGNDKSKGSAYNEKAATRAWSAMQAFFNEIFKE